MSQTILDLDDVSVSFDGFYALTDLSFSLRPGELRSVSYTHLTLPTNREV